MDEQKAVTLLQQLVQIPSVNGQEGQVATVLAKVLKAAGIDSQLVEYAPGRVNLVAEIGAIGPVLGFSGHQDVVDAGDPNDWEFSPFGGEIHAGMLYGRGAGDMKSGLAAMVMALIQLKRLNFKHRVRLLATVGEEVGTIGAAQLTAQGWADDLAALIIGEPTNGQLEYGHAGGINYHLHSRGKAAHSAHPEKGINALTKLFAFAHLEPTLFAGGPVDPDFGPLIHSITMIQGGKQINSLPETATLWGNIRTTPAFNNAMVRQRLQRAVTDLNAAGPGAVALTTEFDFDPVFSAPTGRLVTSAQQGLTTVLGHPLPLAVVLGGTDAYSFNQGKQPFETIIYGPNNFGTSHQVNEHVAVADYLSKIDEYVAIAQAFFAAGD
jgi:succinyl-diaminopimelate desuccinylase